MEIKPWYKSRLVKIITNKYLLIGLLFGIWMTFMDTNSYLTHKELDTEIENLQKKKDFYQTEIEKDQKAIEDLKDTEKLEEFAREKYLMKRENEDIYLIEIDTINP